MWNTITLFSVTIGFVKMKDTVKVFKTKDDIRRINTAYQQKHRNKVKEMKVVDESAKVKKTEDDIRREYNNRRKKYRKIVSMNSIERDVLLILHRNAKFVRIGLETVRFNLEPRYALLDHRGREISKPDECECLLYFNKAKRVVELNVIETIAKCLKKRLSDEEISFCCVNVLSALLHGEDWFVDEQEVTQKDFNALFDKIRNQILQNDLVNVLLLFLQKLNESNDNQRNIIPTMDVLASILSRKNPVPLIMYVDAAKEFEIVSAMEKQVSIEQRGYNTCMIVKHGCTILECFIVLYPILSRNRTCCIIQTLLVKVYNYLYPYPYYMSCAAPVFELLLKDNKNANQLKRSVSVIYNFVKKYNDECASKNRRIIYGELETLLFTFDFKK